MKFTLKNVKYFASMSEETHCFTATIYVDGKRLSTVKNGGFGGCDDYSDWKAVEKINVILNKEMIKTEYGELENNLELVVGDLLNDWIRIREAKKYKKRLGYINEAGEMMLFPVKHKLTDESVAALKKVKWWKPSNKVISEMTLEEIAKYL